MGNRRNPIYDEAWKLYQEGMSLQEAASEIRVSRQAVFCAFKMRGYQLRAKETKPFIKIWGKKFTQRKDGHYRCTSGNRITAQKFVWEKLNGLVPHKYCVVHVDRDPANNHPSNLECVPRSESGKYSVHNNKYSKGRKENPVINKFCLNCGQRIRGKAPSYLINRKFCSPRCLGEYRKGTKKGLSAEEIQKAKTRKKARKLIFNV